MMMLGRLLFGLGAETSIVVVNKIMVKWFKKKELAFAFAINIAIARLGTAGALILSPVLIDSDVGWTNALWVAAVLMGVGLVFQIIYNSIDAKYEQVRITKNQDSEEEFKLKGRFCASEETNHISMLRRCA